MKKVLVLVAAAILTSAAFAEKVVEVGVKGGLLLNAGTKLDNDFIDDEEQKMTLGGDVGIFGHFGLVEIGKGALSLQPEVFFSLGNGTKTEYKEDNWSSTSKYSYNSLDIAVLLGYDIQLGKARLTPFLGPKVGIPLGKLKSKQESKYEGESEEETYESKLKGATIGMDFGVGFAIPLGKFVLGADVRYGIDFNKVKAEDDWDEDNDVMDVLRRGALGINITAGWRF